MSAKRYFKWTDYVGLYDTSDRLSPEIKKDDRPEIGYNQWVPFFFALLCFFYLSPRIPWQASCRSHSRFDDGYDDMDGSLWNLQGKMLGHDTLMVASKMMGPKLSSRGVVSSALYLTYALIRSMLTADVLWNTFCLVVRLIVLWGVSWCSLPFQVRGLFMWYLRA